MNGRTIELNLPQEFVDVLHEHNVSTIDRKLTDAVGYLSMWAYGSRFVKVRIVGDGRGELTAVYSDANGDAGYVIGAVPDDNWDYSFHS